MGVDRPVLLLLERLDFALALHDKAQSDRLYPARGDATTNLVPQQWGHLVADQAVEHAPSLLRVNQVAVDFTGLTEGVLYGAPGDLVEGDAANLARTRLLLPAIYPVSTEFFGKVRSDGLALAVRVRRQVDSVGRLRQLLELGDNLLLAGNNDVLSRKVVVNIDPEVLLRQIFNMPERRFDLKA